MTPARRAQARLGALRSTLAIAMMGTFTMATGGAAYAKPFADAASRLEAGGERERRANERYETGARAFQLGDYREAVKHFLAADELWPSAALSYNIGLAYDHLSDTTRALIFYRDYLARQPEGQSSELVAERIRELELTLMRKGVQQLTVRSDPAGAALWIEGRRVGMTPWTGELRPGEYRLKLTMAGHRDGARNVLLPAANAIDVLVPLERPAKLEPASAPPLTREPARAPAPTAPLAPQKSAASASPWPWVTLGTGAAAVAAAGTFELLRRQADNEANSALTPAQYRDRRDQVDTYRTTSLVLLGTGGALGITSAVLFVLGAGDGEPARATGGAVGCTTQGCFGSYAARF
jgi:tetratricopeptide (TPR) repeat protein